MTRKTVEELEDELVEWRKVLALVVKNYADNHAEIPLSELVSMPLVTGISVQEKDNHLIIDIREAH